MLSSGWYEGITATVVKNTHTKKKNIKKRKTGKTDYYYNVCKTFSYICSCSEVQ